MEVFLWVKSGLLLRLKNYAFWIVAMWPAAEYYIIVYFHIINNFINIDNNMKINRGSFPTRRFGMDLQGKLR